MIKENFKQPVTVQPYAVLYLMFGPQIVEALMREGRKEKLEYKVAALACLGSVLEALTVDRFTDTYSILAPALEKVNMVVKLSAQMHGLTLVNVQHVLNF